MDLQDLLDGAIDVVFTRRFAVEDFDRECTPWDGKVRSVPKEPRELVYWAISWCSASGAFRRTFSAFMVADVTMSLRSRRLVKTARTGQREIRVTLEGQAHSS